MQISPLAIEKYKSERRKSAVEFKNMPARTRSLASVNRELELLSRIGSLSHRRRMLIVAIRAWMRRGDQLNLRKRQVDFQRNVIWVPDVKTWKEYPLPMSAELREVMLGLVRENPTSEYVFVNPATGKPYVDLKKGFAEACSKAGITDLLTYTSMKQARVSTTTYTHFSSQAIAGH